MTEIADLPTDAAIEKELCEKSLAEFAQAAWPVIEPSTPLIWSWHLDAIARHLTAVTNGEIRNLLINVPPGHMKSLMTSVFWPCWEWIRKPETRWLFSSYAGSLSIRDSRKCRWLIQSPWYQQRWGDRYRLADDQNAKIKFENDKTGFRIATSVCGVATGERANRLVVDDAHNVKERESEAKRNAVLDWWDQAFSNRLCDYQKDTRVAIQQRVHELDLIGHLLKRGGWDLLCLPTEFEPSRKCVTSIGWEDPRKEEGELLFPQRFGPAEVAEAKATLSPIGYAGQHQQRPAPSGGARFKSKWIRRYTVKDGFYVLGKDGETWTLPVEACIERFAIVDPAGAEPDQDNRPCYTVVQVWDIAPSYDMILVHQYREQVQTPDAADAIVRVSREFECDWVGIEQDGLGLGVVQTVRRKGVAVRPIKARGSKQARTETAEIRMSAGMIHFPADAPFRDELEAEILLFPNSSYFDQVDTLAHAAICVQKMGGPPRNTSDDEHLNDDVYDAKVEAEIAKRAKVDEPITPGQSIPPDSVTPPGESDPEIRAWLEGRD